MRRHRAVPTRRLPWAVATGALLLAVGVASAGGLPGGGDSGDGATAAPVSSAEPVPLPEPAATGPAPADAAADHGGAPLLQQASGGDGDSWRDTAGTEYRLGLVNAPETGDCFGSEATQRRQSLLAAGFRAEVYASDRYGRQVARVRTADGEDLAVRLAREGVVDDRYLEEFAHENEALAAELRPVFAAARRDGVGLWGACRSGSQQVQGLAEPAPVAPAPAAPAAPAGDCHPDYATCVPVKGDGSGAGDANDLDCGDVRTVVQLRRPGTDPYRFDREGDGVGCEDWG